MRALKDDDWMVREMAAETLGLNVNGGLVAAAAALGEIAHPDGEVFLAVIADDPDPDVRKNARWALQQIVAKKAKANS
ncbi:hypothetical protein AOQ73_14805 [Bradyrhizobium pachyrhizi]|nr:hypothetical protein AOQ73_14805 [Bradyrhizobium pachyrhizi]MCP1833991.1 HEAT repeat protein [Bradyrhizobium sp. USDA 4545]MCP1853020.1 HEAT repeat protein [Bradyrhizobium sp. USDA 4541]MCP1907855.1 HEAT repeat protein [Bradyrhizobium elkanii]MCP1918737.1 HEAT repeat protein [Bradyrhizobium sp. USDA 4532]